MADLLVIPVYFDFASTLCYVAHRVMGRLAGELGRIAVGLDWRPIDLARITGWKRGVDVVGERRCPVRRWQSDWRLGGRRGAGTSGRSR